MNDIELVIKFRKSPIYFIEKMWGLTPQPLKKEYTGLADKADLKEYKAEWFEPFIRGKHITWQEWIILLAVEKSLRGEASKRISIRSGHGIGKDATLSWLILWYLFCFKDAQVPCTAPTSEQIHDILWKEISVWLYRMPMEIQMKYDWTAGYLRITESPATWFARGRTARKENPEALAGVHGDYVFIVGDEASGIPNEIFKAAEGFLTNENVLVILISNPRRLIGYFYDSHHSDKRNWQCLGFNSQDSPIVDNAFTDRIRTKYGEDSDEWRYMVKGEFPKADMIDEKGYVPLLIESDLKEIPDMGFVGQVKLMIDPSGEGSNETIWTAKDDFKAKVVGVEKTSNPKSIAQKTMTLMDFLGIKRSDAKYFVIIDNFGLGSDTVKELALNGIDVCSVNVGERPNTENSEAEENKIYLNKRAMGYDKAKKWLRSGGELVKNKRWKQLLLIRYRRELSGKMKMMSKEEMRKEGMGSPDTPDTLMLGFLGKDKPKTKKYKQPPYKPISEYEGRE